MILQAGNELMFGIVVALLLAAAGVMMIRMTINHRETLPFQIKLFLIAMGVRFLVSIVTYEFGLVNVLGDEDASGWYAGFGLMQDWVRQHYGILDLPGAMAEAFYQQHKGYYYMLAGLFFVTGVPGRMPAAALNCFFGALTVIFAYRVAKIMFSNWSAVRVGWAVCFFPSLIIWSAQTVKEPVVILLESIALYGCVHLKLTGFSVRYAVLCGASILLLLPFRFYAAFLAAGAAMIALLIPQIGKGRFSAHSGILVAAMVVPLALSSGILARSQAEFEKFDLDRVQNFRYGVAYGAGSGVKNTYDLKTPSGLAMGVAVGAAHLFLAPFPWQLGGASMRMLGTVPELLVWWWLLFVGVIPGVWHAIKTKFNELQPFLFFIMGLALLYSMMFGNVGLIVRQRSQLLPWLLILAMVGLEQRAIKKILKRRQQVGGPIVPQPGRA